MRYRVGTKNGRSVPKGVSDLLGVLLAEETEAEAEAEAER
jgi:hypothetical protein